MSKLTRDITLELSGLHIRECDDGKKSRTVEGHAVVFGVRSVNLTPWSSIREVYEIMEPGCINQALIDRSDVVLTAFHDNQLIMGRSTCGKGTLRLSLDAKGLAISCDLPNTTTANDMLELISRGDIRGMSFAFTTDEDDSENCVRYEKTTELGDGNREVWLRHVCRVDALYDVTIAGHPAYQQTDLSARSIDTAIDNLRTAPSTSTIADADAASVPAGSPDGQSPTSKRSDDDAAADEAARRAEEERRQRERIQQIHALQVELDYLKGY